MDEHHAKVHGETVRHVVPSVRLLSMQPDARRRLLLRFPAVHQVDLRFTTLRETPSDLEHLAATGIPARMGDDRVLEAGRASVFRLRSRWWRIRFLFRGVGSWLPGVVTFQISETTDLHATHREFFACYLEVPQKQKAVDRGVEVANILREQTAMPLLPVGDGRALASVSPLHSYVFHVRYALEYLHHAQREILVEGILGNDVHEEGHSAATRAERSWANSERKKIRRKRQLVESKAVSMHQPTIKDLYY